MRGRPQYPQIQSWRLRDHDSKGSSDNSTQPPSIVLKIEVNNLIADANTSRENNGNINFM